MSSPVEQLNRRFAEALMQAFGADAEGVDPLIGPAQNPRFGDYQANVSMPLAKKLSRPPREVAGAIVEHLDLEPIGRPQIAGPGFINIRLNEPYLAQATAQMLADERLGVLQAPQPEKVVIDYSSPNVAKEMHVGHLRSSVIGDALVAVLDFLGHGVIRQNHLGDWGTQFGMLIEHMIDRGLDEAGIADLNAFYQEAKRRDDQDEDFARRARQRVVALQAGDEQTLELWRRLIAQSRDHFNQVYRLLGIGLQDADICGESFYNDQLESVVSDLLEANVATRTEGAVGVFVPGFENKEGRPVPLIVRKSDGGFGYAATDLAGIRYRTQKLGATRLAYVVDARQTDHFKQVFWVAEQMGWLGPDARAEHVRFGMVLGPDRKPFRTREGGTVRLIDLLREAEQRAGELLASKNPDLDPSQRRQVARAVGIGAVKYADLSSDRIKDYVFEWDRMLAMEGNTAPYLQNAHVRVCGIFRKAGVDRTSIRGHPLQLDHPQEHALALCLLRFEESVQAVARTLEPHRLCSHLYELASEFHRFFEQCPVLRAETEQMKQSRLALCDGVGRVLARGLTLLGVEPIERM
ncbi:MAG: arginine--tRNA ligase [Phycisphaeraceae bacterium]|nr:arginine--tRNA ligase [Phycisphaeraceae bacterium]